MQLISAVDCPALHLVRMMTLMLTMIILFFFFFMAQQPPVGQGLHIMEASPSHSDTPQSVGLLWTSDQADAETFT